jgi:hypothetical protein
MRITPGMFETLGVSAHLGRVKSVEFVATFFAELQINLLIIVQ